MKFFLVSVLLLASLAVGWSLKCYTCSGNCGDKTGEEKTCTSGLDKCLKTYAKSGDAESTGRMCTNQLGCDLAKKSCEAALKINSDAKCESACCDSDLCNSGATPSFSVLLVSLCSLVAVVPFFK